jgi:hypothetical protein
MDRSKKSIALLDEPALVPDEADRYVAEAQDKPWAIDFQTSRIEHDACVIETRWSLDNGCRMPWEIHLVFIADGWRVRGMQQRADLAAHPDG